MSHICRAAIYAPVFVNLLRMLGHDDALALTNRDLKLIQIAILFHDSAREGDGKDIWDLESALLLYFYLKKLGIEEKEAIKLAQAVANKDSEESGYYYVLRILKDGPSWEQIEKQLVNIFQITIHDPDCLDIIRARDAFSAKKLFLSQLYLANAFDIIAQLIVEAKSLIRKHGDYRCALQYKIKNN